VSKKTPRRTRGQLVAEVIESIEKRIDELKPTVGDFIRLMQMEREIEADQPKEIKVSWVDPNETKDVSSGE
jgi:hypothetical protein